MDIVNINKNADLFTEKRCAMDIWKGIVRAVVALKDTQKHVNGLQEKWSAEEKRSVTSLMILSYLIIKGIRNTNRKSRHLNVLVVNLNGKNIIK